MEVDAATATQMAEHQGRTYYFCAPGCRKAFESDPQQYLDPSRAEGGAKRNTPSR
jgi:YHS domain-containing protein